MKNLIRQTILSFVLIFHFTANGFAQTETDEKYHVYWIHGLNENSLFFDDMRFFLTPDYGTCLQYDSYESGGIEAVAEILNQQIREDEGAILVGHSAGGLIARSMLRMNDNIKGVITVGTPNNGAGIIASMQDGSYTNVLNKIDEQINGVVESANNALDYLSSSVLSFLIKDIRNIVINCGIIRVLPEFCNLVMDFLYDELDQWNQSLQSQTLVQDMAPDSEYIQYINTIQPTSRVYSVYGNESPGQFYRLIGTYLNMDKIKGSKSDKVYDDYLTTENGIVQQIQAKISGTILMIDFTIRTYNKWYVLLLPNIKSCLNELHSIKLDLQILQTYLSYNIHTDWAETIGAYHIEEHTYLSPIYGPPTTEKDTDNSNDNSGGWIPPYTEPDIIGYEYKTEYVKVNDPHDGIVGRTQALINFSGVLRDTAVVQHVNHLEMGSHRNMKTTLNQIIFNLQPKNLTNHETLH